MWASTSVYSRSRLGFGRSNSTTNWQHVRNDELMPSRECLLLMPRSDDRGWTAMICTNLKLFDLFQSYLLSFRPRLGNILHGFSCSFLFWWVEKFILMGPTRQQNYEFCAPIVNNALLTCLGSRIRLFHSVRVRSSPVWPATPYFEAWHTFRAHEPNQQTAAGPTTSHQVFYTNWISSDLDVRSSYL